MSADKSASPSYTWQLQTSIPTLPYVAIRISEGVLSSVELLAQPVTTLAEQNLSTANKQQLAQFKEWLLSYLNKGSTPAPKNIPVADGTRFQQRVWQALQQIPAGETRRYGELAESLNSSARAVANACRANPLPILVPCHRVVAADELGGYMGHTDGEVVAIKRWLLHHEGYV